MSFNSRLFQKPVSLLLVAGFLLYACSCKKDLLHWQRADRLESHTSSRLNRIDFIDPQTIIISGGEKYAAADVLISGDGGYTWNFTTHPEAGKGLYGLAVAPSGTAYMTGFDGKLLYTPDKGQSWGFEQVPVVKYYIAAAFPTDEHGILVSTITSDSGSVVHLDKDRHVINTISFPFGLNTIKMKDSLNGYLGGYGVMMRTKDGGFTWQYLPVTSDNFTSVKVYDKNVVWICGYNGSIFRSVDGGDNWDCVRNGNNITLPHYHLQDLVFQDSLNGYAVGEGGLVIYTDDGGEHWMELDRFTTSDLHSIVSCPNGDLLVCGDNGTLFRLLKK